LRQSGALFLLRVLEVPGQIGQFPRLSVELRLEFAVLPYQLCRSLFALAHASADRDGRERREHQSNQQRREIQPRDDRQFPFQLLQGAIHQRLLVVPRNTREFTERGHRLVPGAEIFELQPGRRTLLPVYLSRLFHLTHACPRNSAKLAYRRTDLFVLALIRLGQSAREFVDPL
jgi:hypothetical protein